VARALRFQAIVRRPVYGCSYGCRCSWSAASRVSLDVVEIGVSLDHKGPNTGITAILVELLGIHDGYNLGQIPLLAFGMGVEYRGHRQIRRPHALQSLRFGTRAARHHPTGSTSRRPRRCRCRGDLDAGRAADLALLSARRRTTDSCAGRRVRTSKRVGTRTIARVEIRSRAGSVSGRSRRRPYGGVLVKG
jgi:hypothetical protein